MYSILKCSSLRYAARLAMVSFILGTAPSLSLAVLNPPPAPPMKTCPDGAVIYVGENCKPLPGVSQPGASGATLNGAITSIGATLGNVVSGAFGGGGAATAAAGIQRMALSGQTGQAAAAGGSRWNAWAALSQVNVGYSFQPLQSGGDATLVLGGIDYLIGNNVVLGLALTDERTRISTSFNGGNISGNGNTVAPYLGWRINNAWLLDASLGFGDTKLTSTDNSIAGGITGSNKARRTMATLGLSYNHVMGRWIFTGKGSLLNVESKFSAFTFSNGTFVSGSTTNTTQARLGAQAAYNAGNVVPFAGLVYINDLQRPNQAAVAGQTAANDRDAWQVRAGLNFRSSGALYGGIVLSTDVGRSQVKNDQIMVNVGMRF
jgi:outer membrane autotransporter protein